MARVCAATSPATVAEAASLLAAGRLVAFPTETVYGLGARADDDAAVAAIFAAKGRPAAHPLIVHVAHPRSVDRYARDVGDAARKLMAAFWPGPLTVIVPRRDGVAAAAAGGQASIGLRMPAHRVARALLDRAAALGVPGVAAPSANRFGRISPTRAAHVEAEFPDLDLLVVDGGDCDAGVESAIVDCTRAQPALLRPGTIGRAAIEVALGGSLAAPGSGGTDAPRAPGTLASHYAPAVQLALLSADEIAARLGARRTSAGAGSLPGVGLYSRAAPAPSSAGVVHRHMPSNASAAAHELFAVLRELEASGVASIWVEQPPSDAAWDAVRDRLQRAAA